MSKLLTQAISDSVALDNIILILAGLDKDLIKTADFNLVDSFKSIGENIKSSAENKVRDKGKLQAVTEMLTAGVLLGMMGPYKTALTFAASLFGIPIQSIIESVVEMVLPKLESGQPLTDNDFKLAARVDVDLIKLSNYNLSLIRENYLKVDPVIKEAAGKSAPGKLTSFFSTKSGPSKSLFVNIILFFVKMVFAGAGLMYVSPAVSKEVMHQINPSANPESKEPAYKAHETETKPQQAHISLPPIKQHNLKPSGKGEQYHKNDASSMWIAPVINGDIKRTLLSWTKEIYPELKDYSDLILSSQAFNKMSALLGSLIEPASPNSLVIPTGIHTRKDIVDVFVGDVAEKLKAANA